MKCPSCGAETKTAKYCEYCGSELPKDNPSVNIINNYYGTDDNPAENNDMGKCPKCNCASVKFQREKVGSIGGVQSGRSIFTYTGKGSAVKQSAYRTIDICHNCGYTWDPNVNEEDAVAAKNSKSIWWWLLILCIWPIALSVWFYKTDKVQLEKKWKIAIIVVCWIVLMICYALSPDETQAGNLSASVEAVAQEVVSEYAVTDFS